MPSAWRCSGNTNAELIANLQHGGIIKSADVANAMIAVDRRNYAPVEYYQDSPQRIGYNATISAPHMHAAALEYLLPSCSVPNAKILDVGCGSGYLCALFAKLNPTSKVIGIDYIKELVALSKTNMEKADTALLTSGQVTLSVGDGWKGAPIEAPFDCIHVGAAAADFPQDLLSQLKVDGLMVIPVGPDGGEQHLYLVKRLTNTGSFNKQFDVQNVMGVRYVPLVKLRY
jgi:protein-L-isoaspartate(D-aspartate) O-methyltransferase